MPGPGTAVLVKDDGSSLLAWGTKGSRSRVRTM